MTVNTPTIIDTHNRSASITLGNREVELVLTTRATREIAHRYGGLDNLGAALENNDNLGESLSEVIWLIALLANQSVLIHNLTHPGDPKREITVDEVELLTTPGDLASYREAITAALVKGTRRDIVSDPKEPQPPATLEMKA